MLAKEGEKKVIVSHNEWLSFGELLKAFRTRRHVTQLQLAKDIGVHRHAIGRWEQGDGLPAKKAIVLELARHLRLDDAETRQILEASFTALPPPCIIPYPRNPLFTGREDLLETLYERFSADRVVALTQSYALYGLGGIGKTHLALEYAYRHALEYTAVFWISADSAETILASFLDIANVLALPQRKETDRQQVVMAVQQWLSIHSQWLLIWDNVEELELVTRFLPPMRQGAVLITTRSQTLGALVQGLALSPMTLQEGMLFLLRRAKVLPPEATGEQLEHLAEYQPREYSAARELATIMDGLPLALDQAGAYIEETNCSLYDYRERYEQRRAFLLDRRGTLEGNHPHSVTTTFLLASERVQPLHPAALELLRFCAFLSPDAIPEEIFQAGACHLGPVLGPVATDPLQFDLTLAALRTFSLMQRHSQTRTLSMHRLVQTVLREGMNQQEQELWQQRVIRLLNAVFPERTHETWEWCERLLPHIRTCVTNIPDQVGDQAVADVLQKAADYLRMHAQYQEAEPFYQRALRIWEQAHESAYLPIAQPLCGLATLYYEQGKYEEGELLYQRALHIQEQCLGLMHPDVASTLNSLALLYEMQGQYEQAMSCYQRALYIWGQAWGSDHPATAGPLWGLALLSAIRGKYEEAELLYQRALRIWQVLGPMHPNVAAPLWGLADIYREQGKCEQAEPLYQRALHIWEQALGPDHPDVAYPLYGLADLYREQGKYEMAEELYRRALYIREQALGLKHPDVASSLHGLARLYYKQGRYKEAETCYRRALAIQGQRGRKHHPETAKSLVGLSRLYKQQGNKKQALSLLQRACVILEQGLGEAHPETREAMNDYHRMQEQILLV
jgi:tetratricopeptide (TPR) repeat protein/transcriptional regulator with XRE-family HTH domain